MFTFCASIFAAIVPSVQWEGHLFSKFWQVPINMSEGAVLRGSARYAVVTLLFNYPDVKDGFDEIACLLRRTLLSLRFFATQAGTLVRDRYHPVPSTGHYDMGPVQPCTDGGPFRHQENIPLNHQGERQKGSSTNWLPNHSLEHFSFTADSILSK